ncbi:tyrosine-type recombinase/integrase [Pseudomonas putida]|uniref:tyrosine-type recombinase/integrase n=1 Tax=Pseudomonas putida TaxID=303 RepID=UPI000FFCBD20|nr:tyrosine-type recombinase/integrase [Pseudomonas putida]UZM95853.1 site-specific integrase [Pseudomonas putida DOT-T1E]
MEINTIDDVTLGKLYEAAASFGTKEMQDRNKILLGVFEHTGARLDEARNLTTACVLIAFHVAGEGDMVMLPLRCSKISKGSLEGDNGDVAASYKKVVPVPKNIVAPWVDYIHTSRAACIKNFEVDDCGYLFINTTTGENLTKGSLRGIMQHLSEAAGLAVPVTTRMIRNRLLLKICKAKSKAFIVYFQSMLGHTRDDFLKCYLKLDEVSSRRPKD